MIARGDVPEYLVDLRQVLKNAEFDIRYAGARNFMGRRLYPCDACFLEQSAAQALAKTEKVIRRYGLRFRIYDAYRPLAVTRQMWNRIGDPRYVANPKTGSRHNRGCAIDLTLLDSRGRNLDMGTEFDDFSEQSHTAYANFPAEVLGNRALLREIMASAGFGVIRTEWWHFDGPNWHEFPVLDVSLNALNRLSRRG